MKPPSNIEISDGYLRWPAVDGAAGYNIHIGRFYLDTIIGDTKYKLPDGVYGSFSVSSFASDKENHSPRSEQIYRHNENMFPCASATPKTHEGSIQFLPDTLLAQNYQLVFQDEFDLPVGSVPDPAKWRSQLLWGENLYINNEEHYYTNVLAGDTTAANPFRFDGNSNLIISAGINTPEAQAATGQQFYSGVLAAYDSFAYKYGYQVARVKVPQDNQGLFGAWWLLNRFYRPSPNATGPNGKYETEIDIEWVRGNGGQFGGGPYFTGSNAAATAGGGVGGVALAYHWDGGQWSVDGSGISGPGGTPGVSQDCNGDPYFVNSGIPFGNLPSGADLADDFHDYGIWWTEEFIRWYLDGVEISSICDPNIVSQILMYPILNQAVGGNFSGPADPADYVTPREMIVDYICIYQTPDQVAGNTV